MQLNYLSGESLVSESDTKEVILTTCRIRQFASYAGKTAYVSIMLEDVVSVQMKHKKNYWFILSGIILAVLGIGAFGAKESQVAAILFLAALILIALFFITMRGIVSIDSAKGSIEFNIKGTSHEKIIDFLELVVKTKKERVESLKI